MYLITYTLSDQWDSCDKDSHEYLGLVIFLDFIQTDKWNK